MLRKAILAILATVLLAGPAWAEIGRVKRIAGQASIMRGAARLPLQVGSKLEPGDVLVTGTNGRISVTFIDDTRFAVGPRSRVTLTRFNYDRSTRRGSFVTNVERGSVAVVSGRIAHSERDAMQVQTPTSLLGVRGTRFIVEVP